MVRRFITLEGGEGSGKSTQARRLAEHLRTLGLDVVLTREPGGAPLAEAIRGLVLAHDPASPVAECLLFAAARAEHVAVTIAPALARGAFVVCDRFTDSTLAYQSQARGLPWATVKNLNRIATQGLSPDLTVLLDIDPETGLRRATEQTRFEAEGVKFQETVRRGFLKARAAEPKRWLKIDASKGKPEDLAEQVWKRLAKKLPKIQKESTRG